MQKGLAAAFGGLVYVVFLIALAPASLFDVALDRATAGRLRLTDARGTIWSGRAALELRSADDNRAYAKPLSWRAQPSSLVTGELRYVIAVEGSPSPYRLLASPRRVEITNAELSVPAAVLGIASSQIAPLLLTGEMTLRVPRVAIEADGVDGDAMLRWSQAGSTLVPFVYFGDYELRANAAGEGARATLHTIDGPLALTGEGTWGLNAPARLRVSARVAEPHYEKLAPLLRLIAFERRDGVFELAIR